jgi:hypothetical protein
VAEILLTWTLLIRNLADNFLVLKALLMWAPVAHWTSSPQISIPCAGLIVFDFPFSQSLYIDDGATVTFVRCTFTRNSEAHSDRPGAALIAAFGGYAASRQPTSISLQQCTFNNNSAEYAVQTGKFPDTFFATVYSDDATLKILEVDSSSSSTPKYSQSSPQPLSAVPAGSLRINCSSAWLQRVEQVRS